MYNGVDQFVVLFTASMPTGHPFLIGNRSHFFHFCIVVIVRQMGIKGA